MLEAPRGQVSSSRSSNLHLIGWRAREGPLGFPIHAIELWDLEHDEREGWASAVERAPWFDVEELFVRPNYHREGRARQLSEALLEHRDTVGGRLRLLVSPADGGREGIRRAKAIAGMLGYALR